MAVVALLFRILLGIAFATASVLALLPALAAINLDASKQTITLLEIGIFGLVMLFAAYAPTVRRSFGRGFLALGASVFALPLSALLLSGRVAVDVVGSAEAGTEGLAAIGAGAAGLAVTGIASFVGFFAGAILLLIGLVLSLGGQREVVVVEKPRRSPTPTRSRAERIEPRL